MEHLKPGKDLSGRAESGGWVVTRYERIIEHLDRIPAKSRRICPILLPGAKAASCACIGCAGVVNGKWINERELALYLSGDMHKIVAQQKQT